MVVLYYVIFFIFGMVLGSFYNVVGYRLPNNESLIRPRSSCTHCHHVLSSLDMIPFFSYLFLKGKCRYCHHKISLFYPLIELSTGLLFAVSYHSFGFTWDLGIALMIISLLMIVIVSDLNYMIIPDEVVIFFAVLIPVYELIAYGFYDTLCHLGTGALMFLVMYLLMCFGNFLFKKESLGGGDIKLMFLIGLVLNPLLSVFVIFLASFIALPISLFLLYKNKENVIPFGPFLLIALVLLYLMKIDMQEVYQFFTLFLLF